LFFATYLPAAAILCAQSSAPAIILSSPLDYQVFQRSARLRGKIEVRGHVQAAADRIGTQIAVRLTGNSLTGPLPAKWLRLKLDPATGDFDVRLATIPGGFYQLEVRLTREHNTIAETTVQHIGLGEVFVVAGQSNSTNYGEVKQTTQTGMVVAFSGEAWQLANDPEPGAQDTSKNGSFMPAFGDALYARYHVPIAVAPVGHGSTSVRQWLPAGSPVYVMPTMPRFIAHDEQNQLVSDGTLFDGMMKRIDQLGKDGFRALLWHQGESDAHQAPEHSITAVQYREITVELIRATRKHAGWDFPWIVAEATYHSPKDPADPEVEQAQRSLWQKGIALEGPNTDTLGSEYRQNHGTGVHFSDEGLKKHGALWAESVERYLDTVLH
jgi:Carbohydrate esterase, sialic acid-specific acetylesterase